MSNPDDQNKGQKLIELIRDIIANDNSLRKKYDIGDKFRFVRERLEQLLAELEEQSELSQAVESASSEALQEDEALVFVYIYNANGLVLQSWQNMLIPKAFYEYSVNRPIYIDKAHMEAFMRSKTNKVQHGFLGVGVKKEHMLEGVLKDVLGNPLIKVKEGALRFERLIVFIHNGQEYTVTSTGDIIKKNN